MEILLVCIITGYILMLLWATLVVMRDPYSEGGQKVAQLALVWFLPAIGALIILGMHRKTEKPSGQ
ncbi:hypothetical protein C7C56_006380 [Massilia glaciei]|uniref:Cardiolipin synthase N-terminal domain-containing protein n=1 Tax=Massilia glaciei TaxID=1524097 RepID=A0A2U2I472_9BURK|nr:hypothetical protein C7C56_006380 [Massilia glaciei]